MGFLVPIIGAIASIGAEAGLAVGGGLGASIGGFAAGAAATVGIGAAAKAGISALSPKLPPPPPIPGAPVAPSFAAGLTRGTNQSLAAQSPLAALGGTSGGSFAAPSGQQKTLLGQ